MRSFAAAMFFTDPLTGTSLVHTLMSPIELVTFKL